MNSFLATTRKIFLVIATNLVIAEGLLRAVHLIYPLECPPELKDNTTVEWLEGAIHGMENIDCTSQARFGIWPPDPHQPAWVFAAPILCRVNLKEAELSYPRPR